MSTPAMIPEFSLREEYARFAKACGGAFEYNDFCSPSVLDDEEQVQTVIKAYQALGRDMSRDTMHGAFFDVTVFSYDKEIAAVSEHRMRQSMQIARQMGLRAVVFHGNYLPFLRRDTYDEQWLTKTKEVLVRLFAEFEDTEIFLENMFDDTPDMLKGLANEMKGEPRFGLCFDYSHACLNGGKPKEWLEQIGCYVKHLHINDHCFDGDVHMAVGTGKTDWQEYDALVRTFVKEATVLCEVKGLEAYTQSLQYLKEHSYYPI